MVDLPMKPQVLVVLVVTTLLYTDVNLSWQYLWLIIPRNNVAASRHIAKTLYFKSSC